MIKKWGLFFFSVLFIFALLSANLYLTAANVIAPSGLSEGLFPVLANQLKPDACAAINLVNIEIGTDGTNANDLILGGSGSDTLSGRNGDDCIVGGAGNDDLDGGPGDDILLGGPGNDNLDGRAGADECLGGAGVDTSNRCEIESGIP